jgi:hypothetical protein
MDAAARIDLEKIRQLNRPGYARTRLTVIYIIIFSISACLGSLLNSYISENLRNGIVDRICGMFLPAPAGDFSNELIYEIIFNSVDIFKISFIILLSGFTYISGLINRAAALLTGFYYGLSAALCIDLLLCRNYYPGGKTWLVTSLFALKFLIFCLIVISGCVMSEMYSDFWKRCRNIYAILKSWHFWKYCIMFLILFGYVILADAAYRYILKIIL